MPCGSLRCMPDFIMVRLPKNLASRVDDTRHATVSREAFVRQAVEAALSGSSHVPSPPAERAPAGSAVGTARPAVPPRASASDVERAKEAVEYVLPKIAPRRRS